MVNIRVVLAAVLLAATVVVATQARAQTGGMTKATAKLLVSDLIEAGLSPRITQQADDTYIVTVTAPAEQAATAAQVNTFATNRGVVAKVLAVRFQ